MSEPQTEEHARKNTPRRPYRKIHMAFTAGKFYRSWKIKAEKNAKANMGATFRGIRVVQGVDDLTSVYGDTETIKTHLELFGVSECYDMIDPTKARVSEVMKDVKEDIKVNPDQQFLIIVTVAGHGMQLDGRQITVINEHDKKFGFYKKWVVEHDI